MSEHLDKINSLLHKRFKKNAPQLIKASELPPIEFISTGMLGYDWVNGGGGPRGKVEQVYGRRSSGKTTTLLRRIAEAQRLGHKCAYIDVEHELDKNWAKLLGVDLDDLLIHSPYYEPAEITLGVVEELLASGEFGLIGVDSITALGTEAMLNKDMGDKHYGGIAGLMEMFYKRVIGTGLLYNSDCVLVFINQPRELIGARIPMERLPGGRALSHMSAIITEVKTGDYITVGSKEKEEKIGIEIKLINKKNKVRWPFREQTLRLHFANGFNPLWDVIQFASRYELIEYRGAWAYYKGEQMGQGVEAHMRYLIENADIYYELKEKILSLIKSGK
jgi:recombination protein RecA